MGGPKVGGGKERKPFPHSVPRIQFGQGRAPLFRSGSRPHRCIKECIPPRIRRWTARLALPSLRAGTPAMTDTPPEFAEDVRACAGDSGRREAGGKELAEQKAEGQGCGSGRCRCVENDAEAYLKRNYEHQ